MGSGAVGVPASESGLDGSGFGSTGSDADGPARGLGSMSAGARGRIRSGSVFLKGQPSESCRAWRSDAVVVHPARPLARLVRGARSDCRRRSDGVRERPTSSLQAVPPPLGRSNGSSADIPRRPSRCTPGEGWLDRGKRERESTSRRGVSRALRNKGSSGSSDLKSYSRSGRRPAERSRQGRCQRQSKRRSHASRAGVGEGRRGLRVAVCELLLTPSSSSAAFRFRPLPLLASPELSLPLSLSVPNHLPSSASPTARALACL
jgi:hypothetical protein